MPRPTIDELIKFWRSDTALRSEQKLIDSYYRGQQSVPELETLRVDGRAKSKVLTNWTAYAADFWTGFLTARDINYSLNSDDADRTALIEFQKLTDSNDIPALDSEHVLNSLLYGYSVEIVSFDGEQIRLTSTDPMGWSFVYDEAGNPVIGVYRVQLPTGTFRRGELLKKPIELFFIYTDNEISRYEQGPDGLTLLSSSVNVFGRLPLVAFKLSRDGSPFFTKAFLRACDGYDVIRSSAMDDIRHNIDALLKMRGLSLGSLLKPQVISKDQDGNEITRTLMDVLRENKILMLPDSGADADFIARSVDVEKIRYDLQVSRETIHTMAAIPDIVGHINVMGNLTQISGVALRLRFQPTIQQAARFIKYLERGLRQRVSFINQIWGMTQRPQLQDFDVKVELNIPQSEMDWVQYLPNLKDALPDKEILKLLPFIERPEQVYEQLQRQRAEQPAE